MVRFDVAAQLPAITVDLPIPSDVLERHQPVMAYFTAAGHVAMGRAEIEAAADAGRTVDVCSCDQGSGCDVMRILLALSRRG
jgi:hypothetical protein